MIYLFKTYQQTPFFFLFLNKTVEVQCKTFVDVACKMVLN